MKVELESSVFARKWGRRYCTATGTWRVPIRLVEWRKSLPFLFNPRGILVHRVKAAETIFGDDGKPDHDTAHYWCGNIGRGQFLAEPPGDRLVCSTCEAKAVAAGKPSSDQLVGRHVHIGNLKANRLCCRSDQN